MKRSAKVCWVSFVISTIVLSAVTGLILYFTAFKENLAGPLSEIKPSITGQTSLVDHLAHAVPGFEYTKVDFNNDGSEFVQLDGTRSHTHFVDPGPPMIAGKLISYKWFNKATSKPLGNGPSPKVSFPVGTTTAGLTVTDDYGDSHTDYCTVNIGKSVVNGAYCYYYPPSGNSLISLNPDIASGLRPTFASKNDSISFADDSHFPFLLRDEAFQMRCNFIINASDDTEFSLTHIGPVRLLVSGKVVLESDATDETTTTISEADITSGTHDVQILYSRLSSTRPKLYLESGGDAMKCDLSKVLPVLTSVTPRDSRLEGGGAVKIRGLGLINNVDILFGRKTIKPDEKKATFFELVVEVPKSSAAGVVSVTASNNVGVSNSMEFQYSSDALPPIRFDESVVREGSRRFEISFITSIKYGPDHRYYTSSTDSLIHSFALNVAMQVSDKCISPKLGKNRSLLGLAFNPADTEVKLYVSASVLDWKKKGRLNTPLAWANAEILMVKKNVNGNCLDRVTDPVISGLPVSNHDHGVNGLVFDNDGKLHIQVGGFTNAGLNDDSSKLGGYSENPLSSASLVADVNKPGFNGKITYEPQNPEDAVQTGGDVSVFSPGWRNSFGINIHSNGFLYALDNGASAGFGDVSVSCTTSRKYVGNSNLDDRLGKVIYKRYAGHPNRNRGRNDPQQCKFMAAKDPSNDFFQAPIATFESSTNGVIEYTANTFAGQLKGNLLLSKYATQSSQGKVFRVQLDESGNLKSEPDELWAASGLSIEMSPYGHVLMPRVYKKEILLLTPAEENSIISQFTAVMPFRGPVSGGNQVIVTGRNLGDGAVAVFGDKPCTDSTAVSEDGRSFMCKVPPGKPGQRVLVSLKFSDSSRNLDSTEGVDYQYMNI